MASKTERKELSLQEQYFTPLQLEILRKLREKGPMTRDQICESFGFKKRKVTKIDKYLLRERGLHVSNIVERHDKRTTIYDNLVKLQKRKLVEKITRSNGKRGRPPVFFKLKEDIDFRLTLLGVIE